MTDGDGSVTDDKHYLSPPKPLRRKPLVLWVTEVTDYFYTLHYGENKDSEKVTHVFRKYMFVHMSGM